MGLGPRIDIRQSQSLVLTPQLTQAIKLLQLSNLELEAYIEEELSKNPLLEASGGGEEDEAQALAAEAHRKGHDVQLRESIDWTLLEPDES